MVQKTSVDSAWTESQLNPGEYALGGEGTTYSTVYSASTTTMSAHDCSPEPSCVLSSGVYNPGGGPGCTMGPDPNDCTIYGGTVQLLYFPVPATWGFNDTVVAATAAFPTGATPLGTSTGNLSVNTLALYQGK